MSRFAAPVTLSGQHVTLVPCAAEIQRLGAKLDGVLRGNQLTRVRA